MWKPSASSCWTHQAMCGKKEWQEEGNANFKLTCWIGGRPTVQNYHHWPTCCVQCSLTHTTLAHLSVSLPSSIQFSIRSRLTLTKYSYRCSLSLTIEGKLLTVWWCMLEYAKSWLSRDVSLQEYAPPSSPTFQQNAITFASYTRFT